MKFPELKQAKNLRMPLFGLLIFLIAWGLLAVGIHELTRENTLGTDFYIFYHSGQALFQENRDPYSLDLARENQISIFKRPANPGEDQLGFAYPIFALFPILPLLGLPFEWSQPVWMSLLLLALGAAPVLAFRKPAPLVVVSLLFFYPFSFGLLLGNFAIPAAILLLVLFGYFSNHAGANPASQVLAGLALAWLTAKPQLTWLFVLFFLVWAWKLKWKPVIRSFAACLALFLATSFLIRPTWLGEWLAALQAYAGYNQTWPTLTVLLQDILPPIIAFWLSAGLILGLLGATAWLGWHWFRQRLDVLALFAWCGLVIFLIHPHGKSYEHIAYLVPLAAWAFGSPRPRFLPLAAFWTGSLAISWAAFFISIQAGAPNGSTEWPILFHLTWIVWLLKQAFIAAGTLKGSGRSQP